VNQPEVLLETSRLRRCEERDAFCVGRKHRQTCNREGQCTGRFGRGGLNFIILLDEASPLACAAYVDLNPIRAAIAETPKTSEVTGRRIASMTLGARDQRGPVRTLGAESPSAQERLDEPDRKLTKQRDAVGPVWRTPANAQFQRISRRFALRVI